MDIYTRDNQKVLDLQGAWHDPHDHVVMTTTKDFFTENRFKDLRVGLTKLAQIDPAAQGVFNRALTAGLDQCSENEQNLLALGMKKAGLGEEWDASKRSVFAVASWVRQNGQALPEYVRQEKGQSVFPHEVEKEARRLQEFCLQNPEASGLIKEFLKTAAQGKTNLSMPPELRRILGDAEVINKRGEAYPLDVAVAKLKPNIFPN